MPTLGPVGFEKATKEAVKALPRRVAKGKPPKPKPKAPVGRPTTYKHEYCEMVVNLGREGKSPAQIATALGVLREILYLWAKKYPEFLTAIKMAKQCEQTWWESQGADNLGKAPFQANVWKTSMQARFRDDYTERRVTEITGAAGGPIKTENVTTLDASGLDGDARATLRGLLTAARGKG